MSVIQVGLVDTTGEIDPQLVQAAAAALNIQVTRDLTQFWNVTATVQYLPSHHRVPSGVWPVQLVRHLPPGEGGFHTDRHHQPYAKVIANAHDDTWTIDASHEILEMLVDPYGNRLQSSVAIDIKGDGVIDTTGQFNYLVEACDPCEANNFGYSVNGVLVSDFITPHYYDPVKTAGTRYSFTGSITAPRQLLKGGYISFVNQELDEWQQILWVEPGPPQLNNLGPATGGSLRAWIDAEMTKNRERHTMMQEAIHGVSTERQQHARERRAKLDTIAEVRARKLYNHGL